MQNSVTAFSQLASLLNVPFRIIDCHAEHSILEQRITERRKYGSDASEATLEVLFHQQENHDPLTEEEIAVSFTIDRNRSHDDQRLSLISSMR